MELIEKKGFAFTFNPGACKECGAFCCRGKAGNIWVTTGEIENICRFLNCNVIDGIHGFFQRRSNRISIWERFVGNEYQCVFLDADTKKCTIYPVRPNQCRTFPFWEHFKSDRNALLKECPGVVKKATAHANK